MSPLMIADNHIAQLRKQQEALKQEHERESNEAMTPSSEKSNKDSTPSNKSKDAANKQAIDLVRSPICKRRATLKLALAEAANIHAKLSTFAANLPDKKEPNSSDSETNTPTSKTCTKSTLFKLIPTEKEEEKKTQKPKKALSLIKISNIKNNLYSLDEQTHGFSYYDKIVEDENENAPQRKASFIPKDNKAAQSSKVTLATIERNNRRNKVIHKYITEKFTQMQVKCSNNEPGFPSTFSPHLTTLSTSLPSTAGLQYRHKKIQSQTGHQNSHKQFRNAIKVVSKTASPGTACSLKDCTSERYVTDPNLVSGARHKKGKTMIIKKKKTYTKASLFATGIYGKPTSANTINV